MKNDGVFDIEKMQEVFNLTESEIKFCLNIPLEETCEAKTIQEARKIYQDLKTNNKHCTEKGLVVFKKWVNLFIAEVLKTDSLDDAIKLKNEAPEDILAFTAIFNKIAELCGVTAENYFKLKMEGLKTAEEIIKTAFQFMPLNSCFISPSGKIKIKRNSVPIGSSSSAGITITENGQKKSYDKIITSFAWRPKDGHLKIEDHQNWVDEW